MSFGVLPLLFELYLLVVSYFIDQRKFANILKGEKVTLKQQVKELQKKLEAGEERRVAVEEKLIKAAITAIGHVVGIIKSHLPDFDMSLVLQGYNYSGEEDVEKLLEEI